ncbi:lysophospholipid acyltransferase family protein [Sphingomonas naphthae]|uniref:Lysophospholipid acyltransferase family protein n=1 Tax=Sphingomonas naphthae TaxID=1813468 RepID=A0ABY7TKT0_9SPHN|nr:lysophospholipid acyltransferase family protein [Sphingomonas naphthae]WCT73846.1 lysophospholipid acyltransferase family protein [Sphingomonas naphthae]
MVVVRSLVFALLFYAVTTVMSLIAAPMLLMPPRILRGWALAWTRLYRFGARTLLGIELRIEGTPPTGPAFVVAKHESMFETLVLTDMLDGPLMVLKRELTLIPIFGWALKRYGAIPVDREGSAKALRRMVAAAKAAQASGHAVMLFPEGTRVAHGEAPPLRSGFAALYRAIDLPLVPVALDSGRLWGKGLIKHPGTITFRFGDPIPPGLPRRAVEAQAHAAINVLNG